MARTLLPVYLLLEYRAIRFIEDAGLPLQIADAVSTTVAAKVFRAAMRTIAFFAPNEAIASVLRSRDENTIKFVLSRKTLAALSREECASLVGAALRGLEDGIEKLKPSVTRRDAEDVFWMEQLCVACAALSRIVVRLEDVQISAIARRLIHLPGEAKIRGRWQYQELIGTCVRRALGSLSMASVADILPELLLTPVPGRPDSTFESDRLGQWYDPLTVISDFNWAPLDAATHGATVLIDDLLQRVGSAVGDERINLCRRAVSLLNGGLISAEQRREFASVLFMKPGSDGFPRDTGCLDSLILLLPRFAAFDEVRAFRRKYLVSQSSDEAYWATLLTTGTPVRQFRRSPPRNLNWTSADLSLILNVAEKWLSSTKPQAPEQVSAQHPLAEMLKPKSLDHLRVAHCVGTLENLVLLGRRASASQRQRANQLIERAAQDGWCVTQADATRAFLGLVAVDAAVIDIRVGLVDREASNVLQACNAIVRWHDLAAAHGFVVPARLLEDISVLLLGRRHECLPLLISTCTDVFQRQDQKFRKLLLARIRPALRELLVETDYRVDRNKAPFSLGFMLRVRVACARLVRCLLQLGESDSVLDDWLASVTNDHFADVRRERGR